MGQNSPSIASLRKQITELELKLAQALVERDDLARDVEALCMETTANTTFSSSSVLRERIFSSEKELTHTKAELLNIRGERDSLREDLREVKESKRLADQSFRQQASNVQILEREVAFYRQQAAQALSDRDNATWECEHLRQRTLTADTQAREAAAKVEKESGKRTLAERRAAEAENRAAELEGSAAEAKIIPTLRVELTQAGARVQDLQSQVEKLNSELKSAVQAREFAESALERVQVDSALKLQEAEAACAAAIDELNDVTKQKVEALVRLSQAEAARTQADGEIGRLRQALSNAEDRLRTATQEKVEALMQVAELKREAEGSEGLRSKPTTPHSSPAKASNSIALNKERSSWLGSPVKSPTAL